MTKLANVAIRKIPQFMPPWGTGVEQFPSTPLQIVKGDKWGDLLAMSCSLCCWRKGSWCMRVARCCGLSTNTALWPQLLLNEKLDWTDPINQLIMPSARSRIMKNEFIYKHNVLHIYKQYLSFFSTPRRWWVGSI